MNDVAETSCPACAAATAGEPFCPWCGLDRHGSAALMISSGASATSIAVVADDGERQALWADSPSGAGRRAGAPRRRCLDRAAPLAGAEWTVDRAALLVGAALPRIGADVHRGRASHLGDGGRATLLAAAVTVGLTLTAIAAPAPSRERRCALLPCRLRSRRRLACVTPPGSPPACRRPPRGRSEPSRLPLRASRWVAWSATSRAAVAILLPIRARSPSEPCVARGASRFGYARRGGHRRRHAPSRAERFTRAARARGGPGVELSPRSPSRWRRREHTRAQSLGIALRRRRLALAPWQRWRGAARAGRGGRDGRCRSAARFDCDSRPARRSVRRAWFGRRSPAGGVYRRPAGGRRWERPAGCRRRSPFPASCTAALGPWPRCSARFGWLRNADRCARRRRARPFAGADTSGDLRGGMAGDMGARGRGVGAGALRCPYCARPGARRRGCRHRPRRAPRACGRRRHRAGRAHHRNDAVLRHRARRGRGRSPLAGPRVRRAADRADPRGRGDRMGCDVPRRVDRDAGGRARRDHDRDRGRALGARSDRGRRSACARDRGGRRGPRPRSTSSRRPVSPWRSPPGS